MRRRSALLAIGGISVALSLGFAAPAVAATIPDGDTIYVIDYDDQTLWTTDASGALTEVGPLTTAHGIWGFDIDPTTGLGYFFDDGPNPCDLYSIDLATAQETLVGPLEFANCDGLDIDPSGVLRVVTGDGVIHVVDKSTAETISSIEVTGIGEVAFLATDPSDGTAYVGDYGSEVWTIDLTTGVAGPSQGEVSYIESGDFDSAGIFWGVGAGDTCDYSALVSFDPADVESSFLVQGDLLQEGDDCRQTFALAVLRAAVDEPEEPETPVEPAAPTLPATGAGDGAGTTGLLAGGVVLLGAIVALAFRARREPDGGTSVVVEAEVQPGS